MGATNEGSQKDATHRESQEEKDPAKENSGSEGNGRRRSGGSSPGKLGPWNEM